MSALLVVTPIPSDPILARPLVPIAPETVACQKDNDTPENHPL